MVMDMHILLIFIDGFGLGEANTEVNPLARFRPRFFDMLFGQPLTIEAGRIINDQACLVPTDATLGVEGLPQSATGQTALFTGINAPRIMGRHIQGFPGPALNAIIGEHGIMKHLVDEGYRATSANMYTPNYMELVAARKRRHSVTTQVIMSARQQLRSLEEMAAGKAVYQDITNKLLPFFGIEGVPAVSPEEAGQRLVNLAAQQHFTMFEYFQTDRQGHKQNWEKAQEILSILDSFLSVIYHRRDKEMLILITSDHGNFEDFSVKTHTRNLVPTIIFGHRCRQVAERIKALTDITPSLLGVLKGVEPND